MATATLLPPSEPTGSGPAATPPGSSGAVTRSPAPASFDPDAGLAVRAVRHRFGDRMVLDGVDLVVPPGAVIGLLGRNGAGKTTLMGVIFGVVTPQGGTVSWLGRPVAAGDRSRRGYMPQEGGLHREMRVPPRSEP